MIDFFNAFKEKKNELKSRKAMWFGYILLLVISNFFTTLVFSQKVGLVLSGGAASGLAHIGVLQALEDNNIPIDYITGTSMGAFIGALYASGYSPQQIKELALSEEFQLMSKGEFSEDLSYYFNQKNDDASWITLKVSKDNLFKSTLPTHFISPVATDYKLMELFSGPIARADFNFDSLFIPFRCVAADVESKQEVLFKTGDLNQAVRASMTYPFYISPIKIDGNILFDGGLYNNFPADVMYNEFLPDVIIGSNVSSNFDAPTEDDVLSHIKAMLVNKTDFSLICEDGVLIEPKTNVGTFDFSNAEETIQIGYETTLAQLAEIQEKVGIEIEKDLVERRRRFFLHDVPPVAFDKVIITGVTERQGAYVKKSLRANKKLPPTLQELKPYFFRLFSDDKIRYLYPTARYDKEKGLYDLYLNVKKEKDFIVDFGGNFSSRPINTAYVGLKYNLLGATAFSIRANTYFGKLYGSALTSLRWNVPGRLPFYIESEFIFNRWDYFKSSSAFLEDVKPSFLKLNENTFGLNIGLPIGSKSRFMAGISTSVLTDKYYQTRNFSRADTTDVTYFESNSAYLFFENGTLNKKQYANKGRHTQLQLRYVEGIENEEPGSTSIEIRNYTKLHQWVKFKITHEDYYKERGRLRLGFYFEGVLSNQKLFNNYTESLLKAPAFQPNPESKTLFLDNFRSFNYLALGHRFIFKFHDNLDLRLAGYLYQPHREILKAKDGSVMLGGEFQSRYAIVTSALVYHSPIGPASININYYHNIPTQDQLPNNGFNKNLPISFMFNFGYIIFNKKALD